MSDLLRRAEEWLDEWEKFPISSLMTSNIRFELADRRGKAMRLIRDLSAALAAVPPPPDLEQRPVGGNAAPSSPSVDSSVADPVGYLHYFDGYFGWHIEFSTLRNENMHYNGAPPDKIVPVYATEPRTLGDSGQVMAGRDAAASTPRTTWSATFVAVRADGFAPRRGVTATPAHSRGA